MKTMESVQEAIDAAKAGEDCMVICPAHPDNNPSLHIRRGSEQPVVMTCHAGCTLDEILAAAGVPYDAILAERDPEDVKVSGEWTPAGPATHRYPYVDEEGTLLFEVLRVPLPGGNKTFRQRRPNPDHPETDRRPYLWSVEGVRRVLYRLPEVLAAKQDGKTIYVVEGEKDVESLRARGHVATTNPMGGANGKWLDEYSESLAGATVIIIADNDATGRAHARLVRDSLIAHGCSVTTMEPAEGSKDISEMFANGKTLDDLVEVVPEVEEKRVSYGVDVLDVVLRSRESIEFVIPRTIARGDRLIVTGFEGHGKSTLLRQMAVQAAAGIHWWDGTETEPRRVLYIDAENHPDQTLGSWQDLVGLAAKHDAPLGRGQLTILEEWDNDDLDLLHEGGFAWLIERVHAYRPDLIFMGPLTNMAGRDLKDDEVVRKIKRAVNVARSIYGTAFVMEHHAPHKGPMDRERSVRPYGSTMFLKWPDFGYGLKPTEKEGVYEWQRTRFPRVRDRYFPEALRNGTPNTDEWPWMQTVLDENGEGGW